MLIIAKCAEKQPSRVALRKRFRKPEKKGFSERVLLQSNVKK